MTSKLTLADKLWFSIVPYLMPGQRRAPSSFHYRVIPESPPEVHQAEGLLVALEAQSLRDAFTAMLAAERWGALVNHNAGYTEAREWRALLHAAQCAAGERIAMALPDKPRGDETVAFRVIDGGRPCPGASK